PHARPCATGAAAGRARVRPCWRQDVAADRVGSWVANLRLPGKKACCVDDVGQAHGKDLQGTPGLRATPHVPLRPAWVGGHAEMLLRRRAAAACLAAALLLHG